MTALATFDTQGHWLSTSVCDDAVCRVASDAGIRWGRAPAVLKHGRAPGPVPTSHLRGLRQLLGPCTQERFRPTPAMAHGQRNARPAPRQELISEDAGACLVLAGQVLLWVRSAQGFTALLLEPGDWAFLPANVPHALETGQLAELDLLRLSSGLRGWFPWPTPTQLPQALPLVDDFVDSLLNQLGEEIADA